MNFSDSFIVVSSILILNAIVYIIFKRYLFGKPDAGMKFLAINISKDILWLIVSLIMIDRTKGNFLFLVICFLVASFLIYLLIIKQINKS